MVGKCRSVCFGIGHIGDINSGEWESDSSIMRPLTALEDVNLLKMKGGFFANTELHTQRCKMGFGDRGKGIVWGGKADVPLVDCPNQGGGN